MGPLSRYLRELCDELDSWIGDGGLDTITQARSVLNEPLRVAVVGRVKAGKSTLVNALIGRRIAPTATTECTRVVTWYRHGRPPSAELVLQSGERKALELVDGLPDTLGVPLQDAARIEVCLPELPLEGLTLIDTPGLASLTTELDDAARAAVLGDAASRHAAGEVDAIIFVFRDIDRGDEIEFVRSFAAATADRGASAINSIGVLSHADEFGEGAYGADDPIDAARGLAQRLATEHAGLLADVVPVAGLLGETSRTGRLTEQHAAALARLAGLEDQRLRLWERFEPDVHAAGVGNAMMRTLLRLLGQYGVRNARHDAEKGATDVYRWCERRAGVAQLERTITERFTRRADALKAGNVLTTLERLMFDPRMDATARRRLADRLEEARLDPRLHPIRELRAADALRRRPPRDPTVLARLERLLSADQLPELLDLDHDETRLSLREVAMERARWATGVASTAAPDLELAEAGRVLARSYLLLAERLDGN